MRTLILAAVLALAVTSANAQQAWTVKVLSDPVKDASGNQIVPLRFDDGNGTVYDVNDFIPFGAPSTHLADFAADVIAKLTMQSTVYKAAPAVGSTITPSVTASQAIDQNAAVKAAFLADYLKLKQCQTAQSHGIVTTGLGDLCIGQLAKVQSEWIANEAVLLPLVDVAP